MMHQSRIDEYFEPLRAAFPAFVGWAEDNRELIERFHPEEWASPEWEQRVTPQPLAQVFGRPMPPDYERFLKAYCFAEVEKKRREFTDDLSIIPREALALVNEAPEAVSVTRYHNQPEAFYPFGWMGVDGVSYNFYFEGDDYVVVYFSPTDDPPVPWCYPDLAAFLRHEILSGLETLEEELSDDEEEDWDDDEAPDYGGFLEAAAYIVAFKLRFGTTERSSMAREATEEVRALVHSGRYPELRQWLL